MSDKPVICVLCRKEPAALVIEDNGTKRLCAGCHAHTVEAIKQEFDRLHQRREHCEKYSKELPGGRQVTFCDKCGRFWWGKDSGMCASPDGTPDPADALYDKAVAMAVTSFKASTNGEST